MELLKVSANTVYNWRKNGMPHYGDGPGIRYLEKEVLDWLKREK